MAAVLDKKALMRDKRAQGIAAMGLVNREDAAPLTRYGATKRARFAARALSSRSSRPPRRTTAASTYSPSSTPS